MGKRKSTKPRVWVVLCGKCDEDTGVKAVYSTEEAALARVARAGTFEGFRGREPYCGFQCFELDGEQGAIWE